MMNGLSKKQINQLKEKIIDQRKIVLFLEEEEQFIMKHDYGKNHDPYEHFDDDMLVLNSSEQSIDSTMQIESHYLASIAAMDHALEKISNNQYGCCSNCGGQIGFKHLNSYPTTPYCIDCKHAYEKIEASHV